MPEQPKRRPVVLIKGPAGRLVIRKTKTPHPAAKQVSKPEPFVEPPPFKPAIKGLKLGQGIFFDDPEKPGEEIGISRSGRGHRLKKPTPQEREQRNVESKQIEKGMDKWLRERAQQLKKKQK